MQLTQLQRTANQREVGQSSWVELRRRRYRHIADATQLNSTQLNSTSSWVELCRYKRALSLRIITIIIIISDFLLFIVLPLLVNIDD